VKAYVVGVDFGTDSARAVVTDAGTGKLAGTGIAEYPRWKEKQYCNPAERVFRQHPQDYLDAMTACVRQALGEAGTDVAVKVRGIAADTTGSTPAPVDGAGIPLALRPEFSEEPDAMFWLWKDHSSVEEAAEVDAVLSGAGRGGTDYTRYQGTYSSEWYWAKILHALRGQNGIRGQAVSWVEHSDWIPFLLTGGIRPQEMHRNACAAGHKALWHSAFGGLPARERLCVMDPDLGRVFDSFRRPEPAGTAVGIICASWAERLGLPRDTVVGLGSFDAHAGAVGAGIAPGTLVKVLGTSTVDLLVTEPGILAGKQLGSVCGQAEQSILPGMVGAEAGQAAFGDLFSWYRRLLLWPMEQLGKADPAVGAVLPAVEENLLAVLDQSAAAAPWDSNLVTLDWFNGRRYPEIDETAKGEIRGLTLGSGCVQVYQSLALAAVFGSRRIFDSFLHNGMEVERVTAVGGISAKSPFVMQLLADVLGRPIQICAAPQACALGAAMDAAAAAGLYPTLPAAQTGMSAGFSHTYFPSEKRHAFFEPFYSRYIAAAEKIKL